MATVVVVDDEPLEREAIKVILGQERPHLQVVGEAGSGRVGIQLIKKHKPDIIFMDIKMPGIGGIEALHVVREISSDSEVVVLTAYDEFDFAHEALKLGAWDYMLKPARPDSIVAVVDAICREREVAALRLKKEEQLQQKLNDVLALCFGHAKDMAPPMCEPNNFLKQGAGSYKILWVDVDIDAQNQAEVNDEILRKQVYETLQRAVQDTGHAMVLPYENDSFLVVASLQGEREEVILAERLRQEVNGLGRCRIKVGPGGIAGVDLPLRNLLYHSTKGACRYSNNSDVYDKNLFGNDEYNYLALSFALEERLMEAVEGAEQKTALDLFEQLWTRLVAVGAEEERLFRLQALELVLSIGRAALKGGAEAGELVVIQQKLLQGMKTVTGEGGLYQLLQEALKHCLQAVSQSKASGQRRAILEAKKFMTGHYRQGITLEEVARRVHLSPYYFSRLFKESEGTNFIDYLTDLRMAEAKRLLIKTKDTIEVIAKAVGYSEANYFSRLFKRKVGVSPSVYRKRNLG